MQSMKKHSFINDRCMNLKRILWAISFLWLILLLWGNQKLYVCANTFTAQDMAMFSGVTVSPDGEAWTTDYTDKNIQHMPEGYEVFTGVESTLPVLQTGEHFYRDYAEGSVSVYKWVVQWSKAQCIHSFHAQNYHGFETKAGICESYYHSGWFAYCAACEEPVAQINMYASENTVRGITSMPAQSEYLYICPFCNGLEQGTHYRHLCKMVSYNYYTVAYEANAPTGMQVDGYMPVTKHMYNNAELYEGKSAISKGYADTKLRKNAFLCEGYVFAGWNEKADGTGRAFLDEEAVWNLSEIEGDTVTLYAQWIPASGNLIIDANGGTYLGQTSYVVTSDYGTSYELQVDGIIAPSGWQVLFETNGGSEVPSFKTKRVFSFWEPTGELNGTLLENTYTFGEATDTIKAKYTDEAVILPDSEKDNELLVGWYMDESLSVESFLGKPGDEVYISQSVTLFAKWSALSLWANENYEAYEGVGAVDLYWQQKDAEKLYYKVYQSTDGNKWKHLITESDPGAEVRVQELFDTTAQGKEITITQTGYYKLTAYGGKGADYDESYLGGEGGIVEAEYWLEKGDVLQVFAGESGMGLEGGENGSLSFGGSATSDLGRGGGAATEIYVTRDGEKHLLLIAGGGGGAAEGFSGGTGGESLTDIGIGQGVDSEYGGSGGGAKGGDIDTTGIRTTLENPAEEDIAFKSNITKMFPSETVLYRIFNNYTDYPLQYISAEEWEEAVGTLSIGGLNRTLETLRTNYVQNEWGVVDCWGESIIATASEGIAPTWSLRQSQGGFSRTFVASYPTNGNTNLAVSGVIESWSGNVDGDIRFRILNTATEEVLYDITPVSGFSGLDGNVRVSKVLTWGNFDVSGLEEVTVEVYFKQVSGEGAQTVVSVYDTFFYGKTVSAAGGVTGGTSYINTDFGCRNQSSIAGGNVADGYAMVESVDIGYQDTFSLEQVYAKDVAAPNKITEYAVEEVTEERFQLQITAPQDLGTDYYHKVESYRVGNVGLEFVSTSNITSNTLLTGVKGYYYYVDDKALGTASDTYDFSSDSIWDIGMTDTEKYIHIAPLDNAGNIGETVSICVKKGAETEEIAPQIRTDKISITDTEYVYSPQENVYFVKADGKTEHTLCGAAYLEGMASESLQINRFRLYAEQSDDARWMEVKVPYGDVGLQSELFANDSLSIMLSQYDFGYLGIGPAWATRKEHARVLCLEQAFSVQENSESFVIYPQAFAEQNGSVYSSTIEEGLEHSIQVIPDGVCPVITGMDELEQLKLFDRRNEIEDILLCAYDSESGMEEFVLTIKNLDNHMEQVFYADEVGEIFFEVDENNPLFIGELSMTVFAVDKVGNANIIGENGLTFTLDASIYKERAPEEEIFKMGDGAVLEIAASGYVERIEVTFPDEWIRIFPNMNQTYVYDAPALRNTEQLRFSVPLGITSKSYSVVVTAYKNGQSLTSRPTMVVVEGSVLDELHTRIRNNG